MSDIRWEGLSHDEIYAAVHTGPGAAVSKPAEDAWAQTEALILRIDQRIASAMAGSQAVWEGSAAEATRSAMTPLGQWALDAARSAKLTAGAVTGQGLQANYVRKNMPEPVTEQRNAMIGDALTDPTYIFHGLDDLHAVEQDGANRAARAVELMNTYTDTSEGNRQFWVAAPFPPQVTVVTDIAAGPAGPGAPPGSAVVPTPPADVVPPPPGSASPGAAPPVPPAGTPVVIPPGAVPPAAPGAVPPAAPGVVPAGGPGAPPTVPPAAPGTAPSAVPPPAAVPVAPLPSPAVDQARSPRGDRLGAAPPAASTAPGSRARVPPVPSTPGRPGTETRPAVPGPARPAPPTGWRDVVPRGPSTPGAPLPAPGGAAAERAQPPGPRSPSAEPPGARPAASTGPPAATRPGTVGGLYPPLAAGGTPAQRRERRRPDYLLDDSDAFVDDRWFTPAVITPDDGPPPRR